MYRVRFAFVGNITSVYYLYNIIKAGKETSILIPFFIIFCVPGIRAERRCAGKLPLRSRAIHADNKKKEVFTTAKHNPNPGFFLAMLIIFHYIGIFIFQLLRNRKRLKQLKDAQIQTTQERNEHDLEDDWKFDPPVFRQRYSKVYETLLEEKWRNHVKKLVDFGSGEFGLFIYLKNLNIEEILFVDIDEVLLRDKIGKIEPLLSDLLRRRDHPLEVSVFRGSVIDPDYRLRKTDIVTAIELIEHLYPDTLDAFPYNVFSFIKPKLVIITTPNADFNVIFNRAGFRHPDHKFEWTREQFQDWATNLVERFPDYVVTFCGIGEGPKNFKHIGCCSQAALFTRKDMLCEKYISPIYARSCQCSKASPCKGQTTECKLLCGCICAFCLPDFSFGVCTYQSHNISDLDAYRPMRTDPKQYSSNSDLSIPKLEFFDLRISEPVSDTNPSYNIFYKLIQKISYPYEIDLRSEREKFMGMFKYRIRMFSHVNSRFYVEDKQQCDIPIRDIMYGDVEMSLEEVRHLLSECGYKVEECIIPETNQSEYCIISLPQEMEDITSSSDVTDEYSSKSNDGNNASEANIDLMSDWDEAICDTENKEAVPEQVAASCIESSLEPIQSKSDPLFDSGYLKSPSPLETNGHLPQLALQDTVSSTKTDQCAESNITSHSNYEDNKLQLRKAKDKLRREMMIPVTPRLHMEDPNRINELDRYHNMASAATFASNHLRPQNEFKKGFFQDLAVAGTSNCWRKPMKFKDKDKKEIGEKDPESLTALNDAKSITNCIIENSLNKIESPPREALHIIEDVQDEQQIEVPVAPDRQDGLVPVPVVENGDLANNNRDNEGNNLVEREVPDDIDEGIDLLNENLEDIEHVLVNDAIIMGNNNDFRNELAQPIEHEVDEDEGAAQEDAPLILRVDPSIIHASREALFDENSEQDLLEDFDIPPQASQDDAYSNNSSDEQPAAELIQTTPHSFPNWLLQILGAQIEAENQTAHWRADEAHYYCQGDGFGIHPSVLALEIEEPEEADNEVSSEESSNNTVDYAEADPGPSDMFDMSSLPEESSPATSMMDDTIARGSERSHLDSARKIAPTYESADTHLNQVDNEAVLINEIIRTAVEEVHRILSNQDQFVPDSSEYGSVPLTEIDSSTEQNVDAISSGWELTKHHNSLQSVESDTGASEIEPSLNEEESFASSLDVAGIAISEHEMNQVSRAPTQSSNTNLEEDTVIKKSGTKDSQEIQKGNEPCLSETV